MNKLKGQAPLCQRDRGGLSFPCSAQRGQAEVLLHLGVHGDQRPEVALGKDAFPVVAEGLADGGHGAAVQMDALIVLPAVVALGFGQTRAGAQIPPVPRGDPRAAGEDRVILKPNRNQTIFAVGFASGEAAAAEHNGYIWSRPPTKHGANPAAKIV